MVTLSKVAKVRTFKQVKESGPVYKIMFEMETQPSGQFSWDFFDLEKALDAVTRIVSAANPALTHPRESQLFRDLCEGFN